MKKLGSNRTQIPSVRTAAAVLWLLFVASAFSQDDKSNLAFKYIAEGKGIKSLSGLGSEQTKDGRTIIGGDVTLPTSKRYEGVRWLACVNSEGRVLWSARAEEQPDRASMFLLRTDGDSIWHAGVLKNGVFRAAKFEARSLRKEASVQMAFEPITTLRAYVGFHSEGGPDLQVSMLQPVRDSIRIALFSSDLRLILDKLYTIPLGSADEASKTLDFAFVMRLPDRSGYYLFLRHPVPAGPKADPSLGILRLDNGGAITWANGYAIGYSNFEVAPRVTADGSILVHVGGDHVISKDTTLIKISPDGIPSWATKVANSPVMLTDFSGGGIAYRFTEPYLFANGLEIVGTSTVSTLFAIDYKTGQIAKQIRFGAKNPGALGFVEKTNDSLYVTLLNPIAARRSGSPEAALLRFDFDLKFLAGRSIRNAEPHWPLLDALPGGKLLFSYCFEARKTLVTETVDENFESQSSCGVLQKADFSFTESNFEARPFSVVATPLPPIKVSDANGKTSEADLAVVPFKVSSTACDTPPR